MEAMEGSKLFLMTDGSNQPVAYAGNYRRDEMKPLTSREREIAPSENESRPAAGLLRCALDRAQVGPERFGSKGTNHNSYGASSSTPSGEKLASVGFAEHLAFFRRNSG